MPLLWLLAACRPAATDGCVPFPEPSSEVELEPAFPALPAFTAPIMLTSSADSWYLIQRTGEVYRFGDDDAEATLVLDLSDRVDAEGDAGLSGIALDPGFEDNRTFYLFYATSDDPVLGDGSGEWRSRLSRFVEGSAEETVLLEIEQRKTSHIHANDDLQFGPDGYLYLSLGDGGPQGDPKGRGQDLDVLQGKVLRIAVSPTEPGYTAPADNPFVDTPDARPEIWAYGLRNPWRFTFDDSGAVWVGDVGYNSWEEIDEVHAGDNLGWSIMEGPECFEADTCDRTGLTLPVVAHSHYDARSVTGGRFYKGATLDTLAGHYIYADYQFGQIWAFGEDRVPRVINRDGRGLVSFTEDRSGELLAVDIHEGVVLRLVDGAGVPGEEVLPRQLSATGCVDPEDPTRKVDSLYAYAVNHPFWSDGANKSRWIALPEGEQMTVDEDGDIAVPTGTVLVKEFTVDDLLVETRLMAYRGSGLWTALSYRWDEDQRDATLILEPEGAFTAEWPGGSWEHPSRGMCRECHYQTVGGSLGLELRQLAGASADARLGDDQLAGMVELGWIADPGAVDAFPGRTDIDESLDTRARTWLHVNCGYCHRPNGRGARSAMDLRFDVPMSETHTCDVAPEFGDLLGEDSRLIRPGRPEASVLLHRVSVTGDDAMPPLGRARVDLTGVALLTEWIAAMDEDCGVAE
jgi:uncharacterized repeat protein (TIGR03806 family)